MLTREDGVVLTGPDEELSRLSKMAAFLGVACPTVSVREFVQSRKRAPKNGSKTRIICSCATLVRLLNDPELGADLEPWSEFVHSVFAYPGDNSLSLDALAGQLGTFKVSSLGRTDPGDCLWSFTDQLPAFCGAMSGIQNIASSMPDDPVPIIESTDRSTKAIVFSNQNGAAFVESQYRDVPIYVSTSRRIIDIDDPLATPNFDVRDSLLSAVPAVLYLRWAFPRTSWRPAEIGSCVVIDDPLLKPRYGFIRYTALLEMMRRHGFSTSIAFIPWNWKRSARQVTRLFRENPSKFSLAVHGCDHSAGEFGTTDRALLFYKARKAFERMTSHQERTDIQFDPVMVFPQGIFSGAAMEVLKHTRFAAVVNTEVKSTDGHAGDLRIRDVWDTAVLNYAGFPIFTRRYPAQGAANFAFDIVLGKPCIVVIHHDFCRDQYRDLAEFVQQLNSLNCGLSWRSLKEIVSRSHPQRESADGQIEIKMVANELRLENPSEVRRKFQISKRECAPASILELRNETGPIQWTLSSDNRLEFEIDLEPGESSTIRICLDDRVENHEIPGSSAITSFRTMLRRYLCEFRDNYVTPNSHKIQRFSKIYKN